MAGGRPRRAFGTSAWEPSTTLRRRDASPSAQCGSIASLPRKCWIACSLWASRQRSLQSRRAANRNPTKKANLTWRCSKPAMRPLARNANSNSAEPENRLVASELERRWNERLVAVRDLEVEVDGLDADKAPAFSEADRERLMTLGRDLLRGWNSPRTTARRERKYFGPSFQRLSSTSSVTTCRWSSTGRAETIPV